ncbi:PREDICTED: probable ADP-ribosylation factor GTPase-activating protein AGD14 isoform X2 [Nicotiana attenuata]|uniref:probable ADP-ribosylation factor GTPase-activating protein AGD14 isoform X2 n=1 Tax=Nicotiana attenuata TaxID=49451 RepID=UPI000904D660|nr:PREDICTED: probable ADP-ribosylation factor GTPase-activating protein AGD14 isoform X2 [Nicotiana attenuata]
MANRKEDEKNERTIRNLLKLPDNRRCMNCNSLGPQYVCTNFWTFVCTTCSGIHREFTHRVKSVSMAKFTSQEVSALQGGGNASAKVIYLKDWDTQRNSLPDGSNVERLRDFIKHVYVDRRYTGERSFEKPPRGKMAEAENLSENRKTDTYQSGSRSPPNEEVYERRYSNRPSPGGSSGGRSPGYDQRSPARAEVINDWRREDRFGNGRRSDDGRISDGGSKFESMSPDRQSDLDSSSPPIVRPVREILGESVSPLRVIEPPKTNGGRSAAGGSVLTQRTASSSSLTSSNGNPVELKTETSLIDFDDVPEPAASAPAPQIQQSATVIPVAQPTKSAADNWANFDSLAEVKASPAPSNTNLLESIFSELAAPATVTGHSAAFTGGSAPPVTPFSSFVPGAATVENSVAFPFGGASAAPTGPTSLPPVSGGNAFANNPGGQWSNMLPQQSSLFPVTGPQPISQLSTPAAGGPSGNQWNPSVTATTPGFPSTGTAQVSQGVNPALLGATSAVASQAAPVEIKSSGRKQLPEDLFAVNYSSIPGAFPGWHTGPQHGYGFAMQYNMSVATNALPQPSKSANPFDVINEPSSQASTFPSMASLQGALPNMVPPTGLLHTSSLGAPTSYPPAMPQQSPSYASAVPPGSYMGHQVAGSMPQRPPGVASFGFDAFGALNSNQQPGGLYSAPASQNTFSSSGGNPFG